MWGMHRQAASHENSRTYPTTACITAMRIPITFITIPIREVRDPAHAKCASAPVPLLAATDSCSCENDNGPVPSSGFTAIHVTVYGDKTSAKKLSMFGSLCMVIYS